MSSYLINSNYVDPKFPPCEEYSQSDYLPNHSPDYYSSQRQEPAAFQTDSLYQHHQHHPHQQQRAEQPYTPCQRTGQHASVVMSPRGHVLPPVGLQTTPIPEKRHRCDSVTPSPPPAPSCGQPPHSPSTSSPAIPRKDPVVYPWMKKVHVNIGKCCIQTSPVSLSLPPSLRLCACSGNPCSQRGVHRQNLRLPSPLLDEQPMGRDLRSSVCRANIITPSINFYYTSPPRCLLKSDLWIACSNSSPYDNSDRTRKLDFMLW